MAFDQFSDCECNPHLELAASESFVSQSERAWLRWIRKVEKLLGFDLDGNQDRDGYSLDFAYDFFLHGDTPEQYADEVNATRAVMGLA